MHRFKVGPSSKTRQASDDPLADRPSQSGSPWSVGPRSTGSLLSAVVDQTRRGSSAPPRSTKSRTSALEGEEALVLCLSGTRLASVQEIEQANARMFDAIRRIGVADWVESVRRHHDGTFQHCMLVNGLVAAFVDRLGFSRRDVARAMLAATLHDIGKATIPIHILDNPGRLSPEEFDVIRGHPTAAIEMLAKGEPLDPMVLDAIEHHHEYLDGSGYPHGLSGSEVRDLTRLLTISDIFAALSERRAYKAPMRPDEAFVTLETMGAKLDQALVKAFRPISDMMPTKTH
jgi:putative nucleotidyltransferase with HDIG domain